MVLIDDKIKAGELNKRITLQKRTKTQNSYNEEISTYTAFAVVWAKVEKDTSKTGNQEIERESKYKFVQTYIFTMRFINIREIQDMKILYDGKQYDILDINNVNESNKKLVITAECRGDEQNA